MNDVEKRIELIKLLQKLKRGDEGPGTIILRALRLSAQLEDRDAATLTGVTALKTKYPNDLIFANTGFIFGVVRTVVEAFTK